MSKILGQFVASVADFIEEKDENFEVAIRDSNNEKMCLGVLNKITDETFIFEISLAKEIK